MTGETSITQGVHHVGLTVSRLEDSTAFFVDLLGWKEVLRDPDYPATFVSDGVVMLTLWATKTNSPGEFDRKANIGLHHLALNVDSFDTLDAIYEKLRQNNIRIEFSPEPLRNGPARHMMCYEPSGIRVEFICVPA